MKKYFIFLILFSFCQQGISEQDLKLMTEEAVKVALEEVQSQDKNSTVMVNEESSKTTIQENTAESSLSSNTSSLTASTTTTVARSTTTTVSRTTTTTIARTTTTSTTTTTLPWASYAGSRYECFELLLEKVNVLQDLIHLPI